MIVISKICVRCGIEKSIDSFGKLTKSKDGHKYVCKSCRSEEYFANRLNIREKQSLYYKNNSEKIKNKVNEYRLNNLEIIRERKKRYYYKNRKRLLEVSRNYRMKNAERMRDNARKYRASHKSQRNKQETYRRNNDVKYHLMISIRSRMSRHIRGVYNSKTLLILTGCSLDQLRIHLESKFDENMNWGNYGKYWNIDHIIPCKFFDFTKKEDILMCFNYNNLQPMIRIKNSSKQDLMPDGRRARDIIK